MRHQFLIAMLLALGLARAQAAPPPFEWQAAAPESHGLSPARLEALRARLARHQTTGLLVIRNDRIVLEWYAEGHGPDRPHYTASMAKALVAGVSCAVALSDGRLQLDDPAARYIGSWRGHPLKSKITLRHLGSHTSGIEDAEANGLPHDRLPGWKGDFWKRLDVPNDPFTIARDQAPLLFEPGSKSAYSNPGIALLSYAVTAAIQDGPHPDLRTLLRERVMRPIGVADGHWSVGYGQTFVVDGLPLVASWGGGSYTARAAARVCRLMLRGGDWEGTRLLSAGAVRQVTSDAGTPGDCGIGWWSNNQRRYAQLPADAFWASGAGHQIALAVPSLNLICVRNGAALAATADDPVAYHEPVRELLFDPLVAAIVSADERGQRTLPPPSPVIERIEWAPAATIVRRARGSDNWPLTWADDGHQYTAYGDGRGFEPFVPQKLSLGLARIEGGPGDFRGVNLRAATAESLGEGPQGRKASGLVMVNGTLYLLVRNVGNAQLGWSDDRGQTWTWADWKFTTSMGCPTFLNFGPNYQGARDDYVYLYSPDAESAYEPADRMVLARASASRLKERAAYEFFAGRDAAGQPRWTAEIAQRAAVFEHAGHCYRSAVTYNAGLKRYLWCQVLPHSTHPQGPRFQGGFGVFDAPEPWGPWTTAFFTDAWDVGPGETNSFPTKWMSADGLTLYLVFSGDDCFSVRQAKITLRR